MYATNFEYDGLYLSDFGFIICNFDSSGGLTAVGAGSQITFNRVPHEKGKRHSLTGTQYDECIEISFDICKNVENCDYPTDNLEIDNDEYRDLVRWLNRREFLRFRAFVDDDDDAYIDTRYYDGSFNIEKLEVDDKLYGLRLTLVTDKPFGYGEEVVFRWTCSDTSEEKLFRDMSDEIGQIRPDMTITCASSGNLTITNRALDCTMAINNCTQSEVITIYGDEQIISSSIPTHEIYNDFNYEFFKIGNTYNNRENYISASLPCTIEFRYTPIIKDIP